MDRNVFIQRLAGKDRRSIGKNSEVVRSVTDQFAFDELFVLIFHHDRSIVMRAADAIEKITRMHPAWMQPHKAQLLSVLKNAEHKELQWHIAQLITRVFLDKQELADVWHILTYWALNRNESKIVRVNALQGLFDLSQQYRDFKDDFQKTMTTMAHEPIPSIQARIRKLQGLVDKAAPRSVRE